MDTDVPLAGLTQATMIFPALSAVLLLLGLLMTTCVGVISAARAQASSRYNHEADKRRLGAALATTCCLSALLLFGGLYSMLSANVAGLGENLGSTSFPRLDLAVMLVAIGNALWPPLLALAAAGTAALQREARGQRGRAASMAGLVLADMFAFWLPRPSAESQAASESAEPEFEITMASGEEVEEEERQYIENILEMGATTALEVMRPRTDVVALDADWDQDRVFEVVASTRHSRFPVYEGSIDNVIGVLHLRNLFEFSVGAGDKGKFDLRSLLLEPNFIPASRKVDDALRDLQRQKGHLSVVLDEYGGTAGIVTIEDLLEEIVGEIQDEHDDEAKQVHVLDDGSMIIGAQLPIDELNTMLGTDFEAEDVETLGGYIIHGLGRIPRVSEKYSDSGVTFTVLSVGRNRIGRVRVETQASAKLAHGGD